MTKQISVRRWKARLRAGRVVSLEEVLDNPNLERAAWRLGLQPDARTNYFRVPA